MFSSLAVPSFELWLLVILYRYISQVSCLRLAHGNRTVFSLSNDSVNALVPLCYGGLFTASSGLSPIL